MKDVHKIDLPIPGIEQLQQEAREEGYAFIETLVKQWLAAENRFDKPGEVLCGCIEQGMLVAVGGLTRDPFTTDANVGRIRRVYVRAAWRQKGFGRALVVSLIEYAHNHFRCVRLRAVNAHAARFYESLGFLPLSDPNATHILTFD
jgi:GNAT superfamily N-acetyltransferase